MSFVDDAKEPWKSEISQRFDPVYGNENGHHSNQLNAPNHNLQKFVLENNDYCLEDRINEIFKKGL